MRQNDNFKIISGPGRGRFRNAPPQQQHDTLGRDGGWFYNSVRDRDSFPAAKWMRTVVGRVGNLDEDYTRKFLRATSSDPIAQIPQR